jgi:hypothetical protein
MISVPVFGEGRVGPCFAKYLTSEASLSEKNPTPPSPKTGRAENS